MKFLLKPFDMCTIFEWFNKIIYRNDSSYHWLCVQCRYASLTLLNCLCSNHIKIN